MRPSLFIRTLIMRGVIPLTYPETIYVMNVSSDCNPRYTDCTLRLCSWLFVSSKEYESISAISRCKVWTNEDKDPLHLYFPAWQVWLKQRSKQRRRRGVQWEQSITYAASLHSSALSILPAKISFLCSSSSLSFPVAVNERWSCFSWKQRAIAIDSVGHVLQ